MESATQSSAAMHEMSVITWMTYADILFTGFWDLRQCLKLIKWCLIVTNDLGIAPSLFTGSHTLSSLRIMTYHCDTLTDAEIMTFNKEPGHWKTNRSAFWFSIDMSINMLSLFNQISNIGLQCCLFKTSIWYVHCVCAYMCMCMCIQAVATYCKEP